MEIAGKTGLRLAVILIFAILLTRTLKALTARLVHLAKSSSRAGQMREQQTRTLAGLLYSIGAAIIGLIAVLMAFEVLGFDIAERPVRLLNVAPISLRSKHEARPEGRHFRQMRVPSPSEFAGEDRAKQHVVVHAPIERLDQFPDVGFVGFRGADE